MRSSSLLCLFYMYSTDKRFEASLYSLVEYIEYAFPKYFSNQYIDT